MELDVEAYRRLIDIGSALSAEKDTNLLLERILREAKKMAGADAGTLYLCTENRSLAFTIVVNDSLKLYQGGASLEPVSFADLPLYHSDGSPNTDYLATRAVHEAVTIHIRDVYSAAETAADQPRSFDELTGYSSRSVLTVPLTSLSEKPIGALQLLNAQDPDGNPCSFPDQIEPYIESLASLATVALQNRKLLDQQDSSKRQLEKKVDERTEELRSALDKLSEAHSILKDLNTIDPVTGIKNRQYFDDVVIQEWRRAVRQKYTVTLMLLDIDHFKQVNDSYGHLAGDACLASVASSIDSLFNRPSDVVARYGGEEFIVIMPYIQHASAMIYAERVRAAIEARTFDAGEHALNVTISIGVASVQPDDTHNVRLTIARADEALYQAKAGGRNQVQGIDLTCEESAKPAS